RRRREAACTPARPPTRAPHNRARARGASGTPGPRSRRGWPRAPSRTEACGAYSPRTVTLPDQLPLARALAVPVVVVLFAWDFENHLYWATAVFALAMATDQVDGWLARRRNQTSAFASLLDPIADKVLVLAALVMLVAQGVAPAWVVAGVGARGGA